MADNKKIALKALTLIGIFYLGKTIIDSFVKGAFNKIEYSFGRPNVDLTGMMLYPPVVRVVLPMTIQNNNNIGVTVTSFRGEIFYGNIKLSDVLIPNGVVIPAKGSGLMNLNLTIEATQVIQDIIQSINSGGAYNTLVNVIRLKGFLETDLLRVPIETNISLV